MQLLLARYVHHHPESENPLSLGFLTPKTSIDVSDCLLALYQHPHPESEFACADSLSGLSQLASADASADAGEAKK